jgi:hypothetical protein
MHGKYEGELGNISSLYCNFILVLSNWSFPKIFQFNTFQPLFDTDFDTMIVLKYSMDKGFMKRRFIFWGNLFLKE